ANSGGRVVDLASSVACILSATLASWSAAVRNSLAAHLGMTANRTAVWLSELPLLTRSETVAGAVTAERPRSLRIVRLLPACAQLSELAELAGQGLDNPRGRKPRGRADADQQRRGAMGI